MYRTLYPQAELMARIAEEAGARGFPYFKGAVLNDPALASMLSRFHQRLAGQGWKSECESLILGVLAHLIEHHSENPAAPKPVEHGQRAVRKAREYLETNFSEDVSLSEIAAVVFLEPVLSCPRVRPRDWRAIPRIPWRECAFKAREFLNRESDLVSTALAVGYSDQSHLTRRFKKFLGITPGQYIHKGKI